MEILLACLFYEATMELVFFVFLQKIENIVFVSPINSLKHTNNNSHFSKHLHDMKTNQASLYHPDNNSQRIKFIQLQEDQIPNNDVRLYHDCFAVCQHSDPNCSEPNSNQSWCVFTNLNNQSTVEYPQSATDVVSSLNF